MNLQHVFLDHMLRAPMPGEDELYHLPADSPDDGGEGLLSGQSREIGGERSIESLLYPGFGPLYQSAPEMTRMGVEDASS